MNIPRWHNIKFLKYIDFNICAVLLYSIRTFWFQKLLLRPVLCFGKLWIIGCKPERAWFSFVCKRLPTCLCISRVTAGLTSYHIESKPSTLWWGCGAFLSIPWQKWRSPTSTGLSNIAFFLILSWVKTCN